MGLTPYFLDSSYALALLNSRDQWHLKAVEFQKNIEKSKRPILTIEFVLIEIADGLSSVRFRELAAKAIRAMNADKKVKVIPATTELFNDAMNLFQSRKDKNWGLTDCSSFVVMTKHGLMDALTTDEDFAQAGFTALMLE